jgi:hypothetical protein
MNKMLEVHIIPTTLQEIFMQKSILGTIAMMICFANMASLDACLNDTCSNQVIDLPQKFYVKLDHINFRDNKIYIDVDNFIYATPAIFSDEEGYYIEKIATSGDCSWYEWQCTKCGACNLRGVDWECRSCKRPISQ